MSLGIIVKYITSSILWRSSCRKLKTVANKHCLFLTYHRILPNAEVTNLIEPGMYLTPLTFRKHLRFLKKYFNIISIENFEKNTQKGWGEKGQKPHCVISFDDGWWDFYGYAWPILKQEGASAVVFLPTNLIGSMEMFWTDKLAWILSYNKVDTLVKVLGEHPIGKKLVGEKLHLKNLNTLIERLKLLKHSQIESILSHCIKKLGLKESTKRSFMNWDEIKILYGSGLISFGSHTENHAILTTLSQSEIYNELVSSRQKLFEEKVVNEEIPFCYPNGNYTREISNMVQQVGYSSAVSTAPGWNTMDDNLYALKRISLHQDISSSNSLLAYHLAKYI